MGRAIIAGAAAVLVVLAIAFAGRGALREQVPTPTPAVVHVSADEVALAMQEDRFYSDYVHKTLVVQGTVSAVRQQGNDLLIELTTSIPTRVLCDVGNHGTAASPGDRITVQASSDEAQRGAESVLLQSCSVR